MDYTLPHACIFIQLNESVEPHAFQANMLSAVIYLSKQHVNHLQYDKLF